MAPMYAERLINQMKSRPALWDLRNYNYNNRTLCDREWSKMADALGFEMSRWARYFQLHALGHPILDTYTLNVTNLLFTEDAVKAKWKSLRDTYRRELRKAKLGQKSRWVHYPRMSFLRDALEARDRRRAAADTTTRDDTSPASKWYADEDGYCPDETALEVLQQNGDGTQDGDEEEEESFPVIKEEPDVELTMDDISVRGYGEQSTTWMDEDNLEDSPKKMFLLSLLPDLEQMTEQQMRLFKKKVLQLTCDILDSDEGEKQQQSSKAQTSAKTQGDV